MVKSVNKYKMKIYAMITSIQDQMKYVFRWDQRHKSVVELYPDKASSRSLIDMFPLYRGYLNNDLTKCSGCEVCISTCPVSALRIIKENRPGSGATVVKQFDIDLGKCFSCGGCVDVCPEKSIGFTKGFELVAKKYSDLTILASQDQSDIVRESAKIRTYEVRR